MGQKPRKIGANAPYRPPLSRKSEDKEEEIEARMRTSRGATQSRRPDVSQTRLAQQWETLLDFSILLSENAPRVVGRAMA